MYPWSELLANLAIVAITTSIWTFIRSTVVAHAPTIANAAFGSLMAGGLLLAMALPFQFEAGVFLDTRYTFLAISGFFGGPVGVAIPVVAAAVNRLMIGGVGVSVGLPQIFAAAAFGLMGNRLMSGRIPSARQLALLSLGVVASGTTGFFIVMPVSEWLPMITGTVWPLSTVLFVSSFLSGLVITLEHRRYVATNENLIYRSIIEALPDPLNAKDLRGRFVAANPATSELMGARDPSDLIGRSDFDFYPQGTAEEFSQPEAEVIRSRKERRLEQRFSRKNGPDVWLATLKAPLMDTNGTVLGVITHNREITAQKELESALSATQARLDDALATMADGLALFDQNRVLSFANQRYLELFPLTRDIRVPGSGLHEIIQASFDRGEIIHDSEVTSDLVDEIAGSLFRSGERLIRLANGRTFEARSRITGDGSSMIVISDVTIHQEREERLTGLNARLAALADTDELTGLVNRRAFEASLDRALSTSISLRSDVSLLLIDVDRFKNYNDTYGHPAGDACLQRVATSISDACRMQSVGTVARYGGEEIAVVLPGTSLSEAEAIAQLVLTAIRRLRIEHIGSEKRIVTASIGVASLTVSSSTRKRDLLNRADEALYSAKAAGRDCARASNRGTSPLQVRGDSFRRV